jgi:hypothetical protein
MEGCFPLAPSFDHAGPMGPDVATCARMMEALVPGFAGAELDSLEELEVGVAWLEHAEPLVQARVRAAAELFPRRREVAFPLPEGVSTAFMREVAESHNGLFPGAGRPSMASMCGRSCDPLHLPVQRARLAGAGAPVRRGRQWDARIGAAGRTGRRGRPGAGGRVHARAGVGGTGHGHMPTTWRSAILSVACRRRTSG